MPVKLRPSVAKSIKEKYTGLEVQRIKKFFRQSQQFLVGDLCAMALGLLLQIYLVRQLTLEEYGVWGLYLSIAFFINLLFSMRTDFAMTKFYTNRTKLFGGEEPLQFLHSWNILTSLVSLLVVIIVTWVIFSGSQPYGQYHRVLVLLGLQNLFNFIDPLWFSTLRYQHRIKTLAVGECAYISFFLVIVLLWSQFESLELVLVAKASLLAMILTFFGKLTFLAGALRAVGERVSLFSLNSFFKLYRSNKKLRLYVLEVYRGNVYGTLIRNVDRILLAGFVTPASLGIYNLASSLFNKLLKVIRPMSLLVFQDINEVIGSHPPRETFNRFLSLVIKAILPTAGLFVLLAVCCQFLIPVVFGDRYGDSVLLFQILLVGAWFSYLFFWQKPFAIAAGFEKIYRTTELCTLVFMVTTGLFLADNYGPLGMVGAFSATLVFRNLLTFVMVHRRLS